MKRSQIQSQIDLIISTHPEYSQEDLKNAMAVWLMSQNQDLRILDDMDSYQGVQELN